MMTLLPALLVIFGRWVFWPVRPTYGSADPTATGFWARIGRRIAARPRIVWVVTALILGVMALGLFELNATGLTNAESFTRHTRTRSSARTCSASTSRPGRAAGLVARPTPTRPRQRRPALRRVAGHQPTSRRR